MEPTESKTIRPISLEAIKNQEINGRQALEWLRDQGHYVFHGTTQPISDFEPHQAYNNGHPDGPPAIFATHPEDIDPAIFRALIHRDYDKGSSHKSSFELKLDNNQRVWQFHTTPGEKQRVIDQKRTGYVAVFEKSSFSIKNPSEMVSYQPVKPIVSVRVTADDLPQELFEDLTL